MISENLTENVKDEDIETIRNYNPKSLKDYEDIWGSIKDKKNFVHNLQKYKYIENWSREVRENYFPITLEKLLALIPSNYRITYSDHYTLPYTAHQIKRDFGIKLDEKTHFKFILKKVD